MRNAELRMWNCRDSLRTPKSALRTSNGPTRIRTRNSSLEARHDIRFTIEPLTFGNSERKAWDLNPHDPKVARFSKPARRAVSGYLPFSSSGVTWN